MRNFSFTFVAAVAASAASAQTAMTQFMSDKDIMGLIEKAKADRKGDAPAVSRAGFVLLRPYKAQIEYRACRRAAAVHVRRMPSCSS